MIETDVVANCRHGINPDTCKKCLDAERKRVERATAKKEKEAAERAKKLGEAKTWEEYWTGQRKTLTDTQRREFEEREDLIVNCLQFVMEKYLTIITTSSRRKRS